MLEPGLDPSVQYEAKPATEIDAEEFIDVPECARRLKVNRKTLYEAVKMGQFPGVFRVGRAIRIHWKSVISWVEQAGEGCVSRSRSSR